ncbi:hypothetical protein AJ79_02501 [Helicocarpus griseus UAMH5409]|uniref:Uncharacterized protein n=1 Tax=Helicocarpus griseus UAMH5409 TaxID=1447875 RepID=A0A2B7Y2B3_9EURO|nr:hypothetical protein AJ79_02501 [Helicocarpus griseus UAMH5409]
MAIILSTIHPHPKGTLHHSNHTGAAYLLPLDIDSSGKGLYDFRHGVHMPNVTGIKYSNFYADPGSRQLVYDDDDGNEHGGLWIARHRPERDGSAYIRWFNGDGSVPEEYFEVKLLRDRVTLCEVLECPRERPEVCDDVECEWEDV